MYWQTMSSFRKEICLVLISFSPPYFPEKSLCHNFPPVHSFDLTEQGASVILFWLQRLIYSSSKYMLLNVNILRMSRVSVLIFPWVFLLDVSWFVEKIIKK